MISVGDRLVFRSQSGTEASVSVARIETYGRETPSIDAMWTGNLVLSRLDGRPDGPGELLRDQ